VRRFRLYRQIDTSGVSGTGVVAYGVWMPSGKVVLEFIARPIGGSVAVWDSIEAMMEIHGHGGNTIIGWIDHEERL
jgi:hypothetical protein